MTHGEFVAGMRSNTYKVVFITEASKMLKGKGKKIFCSFLTLLYLVAPVIVIPAFAYQQRNWWLLFGVLFEFLSFQRVYLIGFWLVASCFVWYHEGFSIYQYATFFLFCSLWGALFFGWADAYYTMFATDELIASEDWFDIALERGHILIEEK